MERGMYVYDRPFLLAIENPLDTSADVGRCVLFFACCRIVWDVIDDNQPTTHRTDDNFSTPSNHHIHIHKNTHSNAHH